MSLDSSQAVTALLTRVARWLPQTQDQLPQVKALPELSADTQDVKKASCGQCTDEKKLATTSPVRAGQVQ